MLSCLGLRFSDSAHAAAAQLDSASSVFAERFSKALRLIGELSTSRHPDHRMALPIPTHRRKYPAVPGRCSTDYALALPLRDRPSTKFAVILCQLWPYWKYPTRPVVMLWHWTSAPGPSKIPWSYRLLHVCGGRICTSERCLCSTEIICFILWYSPSNGSRHSTWKAWPVIPEFSFTIVLLCHSTSLFLVYSEIFCLFVYVCVC